MPRAVNKKCVACAQLSSAEARQVHGPDGDNCWVAKRCKRKRSHYRNRRKVNEERRSRHYQRTDQSSDGRVETVALPMTQEV